ncbi:MAG: hypothetical protein ACRDZY_00540 [Acidimicrobiales bacterium]
MPTKELTAGNTGAMPVNGHDHDGDGAALVEQVILSSAGLISRGVDLTRLNTDALVNVLDEIVLGSLDVCEEWTKMSGQLAEQFGIKPIEVARRAYTAGSANLRQFVAAI